MIHYGKKISFCIHIQYKSSSTVRVRGTPKAEGLNDEYIDAACGDHKKMALSSNSNMSIVRHYRWESMNNHKRIRLLLSIFNLFKKKFHINVCCLKNNS